MAASKKPKPTRTKTGVVRARIDPGLKLRAESILNAAGLNPSDAIRLFYSQIELNQGLPFDVEIPNATTCKAIRDAEAGKLTRFNSVDEMFEKILGD